MQEYPDYKYRPRKKNRTSHHRLCPTADNGAIAKKDDPLHNTWSSSSRLRLGTLSRGGGVDPSRLQNRLTIDSKFKAGLRSGLTSLAHSANRSPPATPPSKVPSSPNSMSDLPSSPEGESRSLYEETQPRYSRQVESAAAAVAAHAQQYYVDSDNQLIPTHTDNRLSSASPAVVTPEQYAELQQVVKREETSAGLELLELDSFLHNQTQVR